ncbi:trypsin-like peptidase domain-containing protein [Oscillibacter sp. MSJ-2]|uniref:Trypsin-like peptidase domain-containing protein n=1 Tax=Dysosmobacter acutus TaxID=2841504 RepID=A0ABS6FEH6_9FIRM|nr:trypsin-like peptidase domain-containing protein [Dysosmobacter acutus]MBU5628031.1 trypsin-like peptidase domain-containing protein [Dysosmobacter acutus]
MYNDEHNLYHYTYRKDGTEHTDPAPTAGPAVYREPWEAKPERRKNRTGLKIAALALSCALMGGAAGAGVMWGVNRGGDEVNVQMSARTPVKVNQVAVDGQKLLSDAENYAANVNSAVSINSSAASTNIFGQTVQSASSGSGFIISQDGYIVTNHHVINGATSVKVTLYSGETYDAAVIGGDEDYDIAVLKINATGLQSVVLGDSDSLNVGDHVLAVGNPLGELTFSMSGGMVSSVNRAINVDGTPFNMIQTDASINPGNSGGPLFNEYGEVVGIVSAKYSSYSSESVEGLGFAIPINDVWAMIEDIMTNGYVTNKPYLGATVGTMNAAMAQQTNLTEGVYVYSVESGGAAEKAGLRVGDVITAIDNKTISSLEDLTAAKKGYSAGDTAAVTVFRGGENVEIQLTFGTMPDNQDNQQDAATGATQDQTGVYPGDLFDYFFGSRPGSGTAA